LSCHPPGHYQGGREYVAVHHNSFLNEEDQLANGTLYWLKRMYCPAGHGLNEADELLSIGTLT
jgi:hypothetical protein